MTPLDDFDSMTVPIHGYNRPVEQSAAGLSTLSVIAQPLCTFALRQVNPQHALPGGQTGGLKNIRAISLVSLAHNQSFDMGNLSRPTSAAAVCTDEVWQLLVSVLEL